MVTHKKEKVKTLKGLIAIAVISLVGYFISPFVGYLFIFTALIIFIVLQIINISELAKTGDSRIIDHHAELENIRIPSNMPFPFAIFSSNNTLLVCNKEFSDLFTDGVFDKSLDQLFPNLKKDINLTQQVSINDKFYNAYWSQCETINNKPQQGNIITSLCLVDVTENSTLKEQIDNQKTAISLVFIDNYREVLDNLGDDSAPLLTALVDRKLNDMASESNGIIKKLEKDSYIFLCSKENLNTLKESKFNILTEIKDINIGEHIPVTLSIGIGIYDTSIESAMKNAKSAVDLALSRGGDQVIIKENDKYTFFGGKSGETPHKSRIRARVKAEALSELITESDCVYIMGHKTADLDSLGSSLGVYRIATSLNKKAFIILNSISAGTARLCDRLKEHEEYDKIFISSEKAIESFKEKSILVIVDTHKSELVECSEILNLSKRTVVFDHHRKGTDFIENCVLTYHEPYASSTSELITEMIQHMGEKIKLKSLEADALLGGITVDTKHFSMQTGAITFETSAYLKRNGADSVRVRQLFQNDMAVYKAKASAVKDAEVYAGDIAISICPSNIENAQLTAAQAADDLLNIIGIKASFVLSQVDDTIYCSGRSLGNINVQLILEKLGGGGHRTVSGGQFKNITIEEAVKNLKLAIDEYLQEE